MNALSVESVESVDVGNRDAVLNEEAAGLEVGAGAKDEDADEDEV